MRLRRSTTLNIGELGTEPRRFTDFVGVTDEVDFYGFTKEGRELESHAFLKARTQSERAILIARKKGCHFSTFDVTMTSTTLGRRESNISGETDLCFNEETHRSKPTR